MWMGRACSRTSGLKDEVAHGYYILSKVSRPIVAEPKRTLCHQLRNRRVPIHQARVPRDHH